MKEHCPYCRAKQSRVEASTYECGSQARVINRERDGLDEVSYYVQQTDECRIRVEALLTKLLPDLPNKPKVVATIETTEASIKIYSDGSVTINGLPSFKVVTDHAISPFTGEPHLPSTPQ